MCMSVITLWDILQLREGIMLSLSIKEIVSVDVSFNEQGFYVNIPCCQEENSIIEENDYKFFDLLPLPLLHCSLV